jgi:hypothetical protein
MNLNFTLGGLPIFAYGGMFVGLLLVLQVLGGMRMIKMSPILHKRLGITILALGAIHGLLGILYFLS